MVLAHVGDGLVSLLYAAPVLIVVLVLAVQGRRERRRKDEHVAPRGEGEWTQKPSSEPHTSSSG